MNIDTDSLVFLNVQLYAKAILKQHKRKKNKLHCVPENGPTSYPYYSKY